jgi:transposase
LVVHRNNCSVHRSAITRSFMKIRDMVLIPHPPYSPDLAPSGFDLFLTVKERFEHVGVTDKISYSKRLTQF